MQLIDELERRLAIEPSLFRAQLLREDITRLRKLDALARSELEAEAYRKAAYRLEWTAQNARTSELREALDLLLDSWRSALSHGGRAFTGRSARVTSAHNQWTADARSPRRRLAVSRAEAERSRTVTLK